MESMETGAEENRKEPLLQIEGLDVQFHLDAGIVRAVDGASFDVARGTTVGVIGESGCGKSVTALSILRLVPSPPGKTVGGRILYHGLGENGGQPADLLSLDPKGREIRAIRGSEIGMVFQEPMTSFGPMHTIGNQIMETIRLHESGISKDAARARTIGLLEEVGIPDPQRTVDAYPHQFSGGMRQRAMIAMALSCRPKLLIADEPTTAVDVTIQAQLMELLRDLQNTRGMSMLLITHNLALVVELAHRVVVMYLGKVMEHATKQAIFSNPLHPYTQALWRSIPRLEGEIVRLETIKGSVPGPFETPKGCVFHPRCEHMRAGVCDVHEPPRVEIEPGHTVRCVLYS
jgi:peptide/nickel transport system ATP-binding protein